MKMILGKQCFWFAIEKYEVKIPTNKRFAS